MKNIEILILALFLFTLYLYQNKTTPPPPDFEKIARQTWKTVDQVKAEYHVNSNSHPCITNQSSIKQTGGYIDSVTWERNKSTLGSRSRRHVGQREGQICNQYMPCHYGLDCYQGVCVLPRSNSFYSDLNS